MLKPIEMIKNLLLTRQQAYRRVFTGISGEKVLHDLSKFCRADSSTFHENPHLASKLDGRREVWLRIQKHLNMTEEELWRTFSGEDN
jgi:hypothetical protein